ncbi:hypothetical protein GCM10010170_107780 [Dactylosporangium salmoneum]|uniref:UspA domain-containing protein n=2 Tax=Dactylosporangium salmoneum TaxID=53361 RepID=A0ABN3I3U2_9ACTN
MVGHRGRGGFTGMLLGSVGVALAAHATCPTVVVRRGSEGGTAAGRVVVGVDGSHEGELALEFAFDHASAYGAGLTALHVYDRPAENHSLAEVVGRWTEKYPDVNARYHGVLGRAAEALVDHSQGALLLAVGSRGRGGFTGMLLGSVSQAAIRHATCPVAVVK